MNVVKYRLVITVCQQKETSVFAHETRHEGVEKRFSKQNLPIQCCLLPQLRYTVNDVIDALSQTNASYLLCPLFIFKFIFDAPL